MVVYLSQLTMFSQHSKQLSFKPILHLRRQCDSMLIKYVRTNDQVADTLTNGISLSLSCAAFAEPQTMSDIVTVDQLSNHEFKGTQGQGTFLHECSSP